ncbi:hypothetical protein FSP39_002070 [Pinctada imbricata]|uniref:RNA-binding protein 48 n=1 Tax=Pinctada imbricata TaxID=66713 RepID=A0AA88YLH0_PINIB|nr:hypothetical protein FSP39_002070 [Pinctada imbricata]
MAAPVKIPQHHIRQEVCAYRPTYREGRVPKAVKVYTINQESRYLLVQGVPALGAGQDLVKLFAVHGTVEEYRVLDEYPSADQFTDVYLIKFAKIQSARFAKKKLDDWSFLGGVLHLSYAPEFETVEETWQKLQDRRRLVASRVRLHEREDQSARSNVRIDQSETRSEEDMTKSDSDFSHEGHTPSLSSVRVDNCGKGHVSHRQEDSSYPGAHSKAVSQEMSVTSTHNLNHVWNANQNRQHDAEMVPKIFVPAPPSTWIPPPPKPHTIGRGRGQGQRNRDYPFARVPSSHATLPKEYVEVSREQMSQSQNIFNNTQFRTDLVVTQSANTKSVTGSPNAQRGNAREETSKTKQEKDVSNGVKQAEGTPAGSDSKNNVKEKIVNGLVVREYSTDRPTPKFVPRQTLNLLKKKSTVSEAASDVKKSKIDQELKRNAFTLGKPQGPGCTEQTKSKVSDQEKSMEKTRMEIRKRVAEYGRVVFKEILIPVVFKTKEAISNNIRLQHHSKNPKHQMQKHQVDKYRKRRIRAKERPRTTQKHQIQRTTHKPTRPIGNRCRLRTAITQGNSRRRDYPGLHMHNPPTFSITQRSRRTYNCGVKQPPHCQMTTQNKTTKRRGPSNTDEYVNGYQ